MISAEVICDSISDQGKRPLSYKLRYPKFIHGEFMTHRVISRNASSSRAVPTSKLLEEVRSEELRAGPVFWGKNQPGMQAAEELGGLNLIQAKNIWADAALFASDQAEAMLRRGAHKQSVNRLLEPFSHINVVATATEWDNFFGLRLHKDAQPEMRALAIAMWEARKASTPSLLKPGQWHLPFVGCVWPLSDGCQILEQGRVETHVTKSSLEDLIKVSVARCARVSYQSFETGKRSTIQEDLKLYDRLLGAQPLHASPAEHQCTPIQYYNPTHHGNLVGWCQYRKMLPNEACAPIPEEFL